MGVAWDAYRSPSPEAVSEVVRADLSKGKVVPEESEDYVPTVQNLEGMIVRSLNTNGFPVCEGQQVTPNPIGRGWTVEKVRSQLQATSTSNLEREVEKSLKTAGGPYKEMLEMLHMQCAYLKEQY